MNPLDALLTEALPFWEGLTPQEQQLLLDTAVPSTIPKGTITHRADQDCKGIMLVLAGQLRAYILSEEGREVTLYRVQGGDTCVMSSSCLMDVAKHIVSKISAFVHHFFINFSHSRRLFSVCVV